MTPFGATVDVMADDDRVFDALRPALVGYPDVGVRAQFTLAIRTGADRLDDPMWPITTTTVNRGSLTLRCGSAWLQTDGRSRVAEGELPPSMLAIPDAVRTWVEGAFWSLLIGGGHLNVVHAAFVAHAGKGLLLRGPSGAGKSTLTYACLQSGFQVISDDWVYGVASRPADRLVGYPWRMFLVQDSAAFFPELARATAVPHPGADRMKIPIEPPAGSQVIEHRVDAVVLLDPDPLFALSPAPDGASRFWAVALPSERSDLPTAWIDGLLDRPCFVLRRGTDPMAAADQLRALAESLP